jgi:hypothetical protein
MPESSLVHIAITPRVIYPNGFVTLKLTYSGVGHCDVAQGSTCTGGLPEAGLVRVDCNTHKVLRVQSIAVQDEPTQCYTLPPFSAPTAPFYAIIEAFEGNCSPANCVSADYVLVEPPCGGTSASVADSSNSAWGRPVAAIPLASAAPGASCPLTVTIRRTDGGHSGLTFGEPPTFLKATNPDAAPPNGCVSGCVDLEVTVEDSQGRPVSGATVTASVTPVRNGIPLYPSGADPDTGHLCLADQVTNCGRGANSLIDGLTTNNNGQLILRYWAPGLIENATVIVSVTAKATCDTSICGSGEESTIVPRNYEFTIFAKPIFQRDDVLLSKEDLEAIVDWRKGDGFLPHATNALHAVDDAKDLVDALETFGRELPPGVALPLTVALFIREEAKDRRVMEQAFAALFAARFGLEADGIGAADSPITNALPDNFVDIIAASPGLFSHGQGLLYRLGAALEGNRATLAPREKVMKLSVFDVSYCENGAVCGPGYLTGDTRLAGIHAFLYFDFQIEANRLDQEVGVPFFFWETHFVIPYNADAWMFSQLHRKG